MLNNFLKVNLPYGMQKNDKDEWMVFNREYKPIGFYSYEIIKYHEYPIFVKFKTLTDKKILQICDDPSIVRRDESGKIRMFWLYSDLTNPVSTPTKANITMYFYRLSQLAKLKTEDPKDRY